MGFSYFSYDQEYADRILQGKQIIPSITLFHVFNYDDFYDVYSTDHGNEEACETIDWSYFDELVAELCEELELTILEKPLMKDDGAAVVHHDDGVDEVEGEIILWRPAAGLK
uniref:Uncharacterized protein n=1 Tax=Populus trichocarpa TaxID=3694 RepID=B9N3U0_POPTR